MPKSGLTLEYLPTNADLTSFAAQGSGYQSYPTPFLATGPGQFVPAIMSSR
jgi:hypothetical protein